MGNKERLQQALDGETVPAPGYAVYDAFINDGSVDWKSCFSRGMVLIDHVDPVASSFPNLQIREEVSEKDGFRKKQIIWETDNGELRECFMQDLGSPLLPWRTEHLIKEDSDYRIMHRALEEAAFSLAEDPQHLFVDPAAEGIDESARFSIASLDRTPMQKVQIDYTGLEKFSIDFITENRDLLELLELMNTQMLDRIAVALMSPLTDIKLWENLSIDVLGPAVYRRYQVPLYRKIMGILSDSGKRLHVHYDGKLAMIREDIAEIGFGGIDSFCYGPEGDVSFPDAQRSWGQTFLWVHPSMSWFTDNPEDILKKVRDITGKAENPRYCFIISEDVPVHAERNITAILEELA